jgi:pimeloyl-ACP methyl ester carboxylesterase
MPKVMIGELEIHYVEQGTGETLLIFPDHLHPSQAYESELNHFSERFHVLSFDYPGTGKSTRDVLYQDEREYDLWNFWADLACHLLMALDIDGAWALGTGGGALSALHFAGKQAGLHRLTAHGVIADSFLARLDSRTLHRRLDTREHYYVRRTALLQDQHGDDWREVVDADTAFLRRLADRGGYALPDCVLNAVAAPVLLTGSVRDVLCPGIAEEFARISEIVPDCSIYLASHSGHRYGEEHPFMWTDPETFRQVAGLFFSKNNRAE